MLKMEMNTIYDEIRQQCSPLQYMLTLRVMTDLRKKLYEDVMTNHTRKIARLINKEFDVDEHITNISSYRLSFFEKLVLCRGLKFSIAQPVPARDVKASFEKAYWRLEPTLPEDQKELAAATLRSIALNYIQRRGPRPPKALQQAINQLRRREDIVITKPDKGSGVVVMDKTEYIRLLSDASIKDTTKFTPINTERPKTRGRPPKHYHPLLQKEKQLESVVRKILPKPIADTVCRKGSRLAHLYGLPKTHKQQLSMRPILSSTGTYNFALAKWLEEKLKPLSLNQHTICDIFSFAEVIRETPLNPNDILVSYDVCALFTNVPLDETIEIIAEKAFKNNWFNETHGLNLTKTGLTELLRIATKDQLFQFDGQLYEQVDGVAMGSPLGPLMANVFLCSIEEQLDRNNKLPSFYKRYVDDTLATMPNIQAATAFLSTLNECHPAIQFTMEIAENNKLPFLGMMIEKNGCHLTTSVYHKPTDTGLLLHYQSHVDQRYKRSLLNTMLNRAYRLSSTKESFTKECQHLKRMFTKLKYPVKLINSAIAWYTSSTIQSRHETPTELDAATQKPVRITLPFKDQKSADTVRHQLKDLGRKIGTDLQPVFTSRKIEGKLKIQEEKPALINHQCVVYTFKCDSCDADYIGYTTRHLHQRIEEHKASVIGKHLKEAHSVASTSLEEMFSVLKKCRGKMDCLIHEMLFIREQKPKLNTQSDSIRAKQAFSSLLRALEYTSAFVRVIHDEEMWLYKNPKSKNTISTEMLFVIAAVLPAALILLLGGLRKDKIDGIQAILALTLTLGLNGVVTNIVKVLVGRPRPDYFWRCYPNGVIPASIECDGNPDEIIEGRKSFPSGHSSFAFCGLGFISLYLAGKLHCFQAQGRGQGWKLCIALAPVIVAMALALTRYSDYRHHWQDIMVGAMIGYQRPKTIVDELTNGVGELVVSLFFAYLCYRQYYPALNRPHCHMPYYAIMPAKFVGDEHEHMLPVTVREIKDVHPIVTKSL
ncbi:Phosphatidate phosphatase PPAPDC1A [Stylophora pistillata]|uniref:Phosphatidate phosphatase PPAPDC1A n=1 Tax=Stylophora pistillata TaxID=50429 RepID=A0A2B4STC1_STYPI|nr:Phosphatidate phosphatase PPAPDC1A [Stylophora pistillata]